MNYKKNIIITTLNMLLFTYMDGSVTKPRVSNIKETAGQIRIKVIEAEENLLKNFSSLIKEDTCCIDEVIEAIKDSAADDGEFMALTMTEKKVYLQKLETISAILERQMQELKNIGKNIKRFKN